MASVRQSYAFMSSTKRSTYRHGDLENQATKAALKIIEKEGADGLSLRQVAAQVGVAHRALYNHFSDRDGLLDAVATCGFNELADTVDRTRSQKAFIKAYVGFGLSRPHLYGLMTNRPHATMSETPPLQTAVHRVITKAWNLFGDPEGSSAQNRKTVMAIYMLLHGALSLRGNGILDLESDQTLIADLTESATRISRADKP